MAAFDARSSPQHTRQLTSVFRVSESGRAFRYELAHLPCRRIVHGRRPRLFEQNVAPGVARHAAVTSA
jgi:hypothetical protein